MYSSFSFSCFLVNPHSLGTDDKHAARLLHTQKDLQRAKGHAANDGYSLEIQNALRSQMQVVKMQEHTQQRCKAALLPSTRSRVIPAWQLDLRKCGPLCLSEVGAFCRRCRHNAGARVSLCRVARSKFVKGVCYEATPPIFGQSTLEIYPKSSSWSLLGATEALFGQFSPLPIEMSHLG